MKHIINLIQFYLRNTFIAILLMIAVSVIMYFFMGFILEFIPPTGIPE